MENQPPSGNTPGQNQILHNGEQPANEDRLEEIHPRIVNTRQRDHERQIRRQERILRQQQRHQQMNVSRPSSPEPVIDNKPTEVAGCDTESLKSVLECPVCYEMMSPPIHQCQRGHNLCHKCRPRVLHCPVCRDSVPLTLRNRAMENVFYGTKFVCKYKELGCSEGIPADKFAEHVKKCGYTPYYCNYVNRKKECKNEKIPFCELINHLLTVHKIPKYKSEEYCTHVEKLLIGVSIPLAIWEFNEKLFLHKMKTNYNNETVFTVLLLGDYPVEEADKYYVDVQSIQYDWATPKLMKSRIIRSIKKEDRVSVTWEFKERPFRYEGARFIPASESYTWKTRLFFNLHCDDME